MTTPDTRLDEECISNETEYDGIPEGWAKTTLQELLDVLESGSRPKGGVRGISEGIPSIGGEHLNSDGSFNLDSIKYVPQSFFDRMNQGHIQFNDILVVKDGATTGKVSLVREDFPFKTAVVNEHVFICRPSVELFSPFLFYFLFSDEGQNRILENFRGSAQGGINHSFAAGTMVQIAPVAEQKRIVAKIEELLPRVNAAKERLKRASQIIKRFRQAILSAACSGRLTEGWREKEKHYGGLSQVLGQVRVQRRKEFEESNKVARTTGQRPPQRPLNLEPGIVEELSTVELPKIPEEWIWVATRDATAVSQYGSSIKADSECQDGVPILRMGNIQDGKIDFSDLKYVRFAEELEAFVLEEGDFLFNRTNSPELVGKSAIFDSHTATLFASYLIRLKFDKELANPAYVCYWMNSPYGRAWAREVRTDGVSQSNINATKLLMMPLPLPPLPEQNEIVCRVKSLFELADAIEKRIEAARLRADKLAQSILAKAFRGELIPTEAELARQEGRSYEPASILLERVRAEKGKPSDR